MGTDFEKEIAEEEEKLREVKQQAEEKLRKIQQKKYEALAKDLDEKIKEFTNAAGELGKIVKEIDTWEPCAAKEEAMVKFRDAAEKVKDILYFNFSVDAVGAFFATVAKSVDSVMSGISQWQERKKTEQKS